jgi:hypothetical protein
MQKRERERCPFDVGQGDMLGDDHDDLLLVGRRRESHPSDPPGIGYWCSLDINERMA